MRRITSLIMIAALLSVSGIPVLPKAAVCHAAEHTSDCNTCHNGEHAMRHEAHANHDAEQQQMMAHQGHHDHHAAMESATATQSAEAEAQPQMHKHQKPLSAGEKECRIECGCGCNHSADGLPHLLAPHVASIVLFESGEQFARTESASYPVLYSFTLNNPSPPPKAI